MNGVKPKWVLVIVGGVLGIAVLSWQLPARPPQAGQPTPQPTITWSVPQVTETLFPGTSASKTVRFRSSANLSGVVVGVTPSLNGMVSVNPASIPSIAANQDYQITLTLSAPGVFQKRSIGGTIRLTGARSTTTTYATPLQIGIRTDFLIHSDSSLGITLSYPTNWTVWSPDSGSGELTVSNVLPDVPGTNPASFIDVCKIEFNSLNKPASIAFQEWLTQFGTASGDLLTVSSTPITVNALSGVRRVTDEIAVSDTVYLSLSDTRVISIGMICGPNALVMGRGIFEQMLSTIRLP